MLQAMIAHTRQRAGCGCRGTHMLRALLTTTVLPFAPTAQKGESIIRDTAVDPMLLLSNSQARTGTGEYSFYLFN